MDTKNRLLRVFLCHAHEDKATVRDLYRQLCAEGWLDVWLDEEKLLPGQEWDIEIEKAVEVTNVVLVCLSSHSVDKEGYIQKELRFVLNIAEEKPEGTIFVIPLKLGECEVPRRLRAWQWVDYFPKDRRVWAYQRLLESLKLRATRLGISMINTAEEKARIGEEEHVCKEAEEKVRKEKEDQEWKAAQELARRINEDKVQQEKETRERREAEEQARLAREKLLQEKVVETRHEPIVFPDSAEKRAGVRKNGKKVNRIRLRWIAGIGTIAVIIVIGLVLNTIYDNLPAEKKFLNPNLPHGGTAPTTIVSFEISPIDGMTMILIPAGEFEMGSESIEIDEQPVHSVYLDDYWIDQIEVTNKMYALCVTAGNCAPPQRNSSYTRKNYYGNPEYGYYPVINVSWDDASAYCAWAGRRLPSEAEWEKSARDADGRIYPWGNSYPSCSLANYGECVGDTIAVGSYPSGSGSYGVLDMAGNVSEWVADWYDVYPGGDPKAHDYSGHTYRVIRGGSWYSDLGYYLRSAHRGYNAPTNTSSSIGFRCVRDASP